MDSIIINILRDYFGKREDILMAFLFGSRTEGKNVIESDADIAVYVACPKVKEIWYPDPGKWRLREVENNIWNDLEKLLHTPVDLVVLNYAKPVIAWEAVRGIPLSIKDDLLYIDYMLTVSKDAMELQEWTLGCWRLKTTV